VTATASTGYGFVNWTEGATVVSTDASYAFTANADRTLVANFAIEVAEISIRVRESLVVPGEGDWVRFDLVVRNVGPGPISAASLMSVLPEAFSAEPGDSDWQCELLDDPSTSCGSGADIIDELIDLAPGQGRRYLMTGLVPAMHPRQSVTVEAVLEYGDGSEISDSALYQRCATSNWIGGDGDGSLQPHRCIYSSGFEVQP
jgi:hypothetical protein